MLEEKRKTTGTRLLEERDRLYFTYYLHLTQKRLITSTPRPSHLQERACRTPTGPWGRQVNLSIQFRRRFAAAKLDTIINTSKVYLNSGDVTILYYMLRSTTSAFKRDFSLRYDAKSTASPTTSTARSGQLNNVPTQRASLRHLLDTEN